MKFFTSKAASPSEVASSSVAAPSFENVAHYHPFEEEEVVVVVVEAAVSWWTGCKATSRRGGKTRTRGSMRERERVQKAMARGDYPPWQNQSGPGRGGRQSQLTARFTKPVGNGPEPVRSDPVSVWSKFKIQI